MTPAAPSPTDRAPWGWWVVPSVVALGPGVLERAGVAIEEDGLRRVLAFVVLAVALLPAWRSRPGPWAWALAGLAGFAGAAILWPRGETTGWGTSAGTPWSPLLLALAVLCGALRLRSPRERFAAGRGLVVAATLSAAWAIVDRIAGRPAIGPFGRTGIAGPALAAALPFLAWPLVVPGRLARALPLVVGLTGLAATGSRTGYVAGAIGLAVSAASVLRPRALPAALGVAAAVAGVYVALLAGLVPADAWVAQGDTVQVRAGLARAATTLVRERPSGFGAHGFSTDVLRVRDLQEARISGGRRPLLAHDDVLEAAVEGGVVAGVALLAFLLLATRRAVVRVRAADEEGERCFFGAVLGSLAAIAIASLAENPLFATTTAMLFGLGAGVAAQGRDRNDPSGSRGGASPVAHPSALALAIVGAMVVSRALVVSDARSLALGTFRIDERTRAAAYELAASRARAGHFEKAREAYTRILEVDPGATEARLDLAETYRVEGRIDDALTILEGARRADPTRFDVPQRIGHVRYGTEPVPSKRAPLLDPLPVLRAYNDAAALAPGRFETPVAYARVHRRQGRLRDASDALAAAKGAAAARGQGLPGELLLESFRLAEVQGAHPRDALGILTLALTAGPGGANDLLREAEACLDAAEAQDASEADAKKDAEAAALRYAGLVVTARVEPGAVRATAARAAVAGKHRRALALYRALLTDPFVAADPDVALAARESATHVDRAAAEMLAARARVLLGFEALGKGDATGAERHFRAALSRDEADPASHYGLARALSRQGRKEEAGRSLRRALDLEPSVAVRALGDPDLEGVTPARPPP